MEGQDEEEEEDKLKFSFSTSWQAGAGKFDQQVWEAAVREKYAAEFKAVEEAEVKYRDTKAKLLAHKVIASDLQTLAKFGILLLYGEESEEYLKRLWKLDSKHSAEELKEMAEAMKEVEKTMIIAQPVTQWTGRFEAGVPQYREPDEPELWDLYFAHYSAILRTVVIAAVIRKQTTAQCRRIGFKGVFKKKA